MEEIWLNARSKFCLIKWTDVKAGEMIYHYSPKFKDNKAYGPFTVIDPTIGKVKNLENVEFCLPDIQLLRLCN